MYSSDMQYRSRNRSCSVVFHITFSTVLFCVLHQFNAASGLHIAKLSREASFSSSAQVSFLPKFREAQPLEVIIEPEPKLFPPSEITLGNYEIRVAVDPIFENVAIDTGIVQPQPDWKFGGPCVADLNGDGFYDLILSNHNGSPTRIYFGKEDGTFDLSDFRTKNFDIHGVSVALRTAHSLDRVLAVSVGGGNGNNARIPEIYLVQREKNFTDVSEELGFGQVYSRHRNTLFLDLAMRRTEVSRRNLGGPDALVTSFLGSPSDDLRQYAYKNEQGQYSLMEVPGFMFQQRGRVEITDVDDDQNFEVISIRDLLFYRLVKPFEFIDVTSEILSSFPQILPLSVTAIAEIDIDNDGYFDLYVARASLNRMTKRKPSPPHTTKDIFLHNESGKYANWSVESGALGESDSMGVTVGDFNNDGYVDVFVVQFEEPDVFLMNNGNNTFRRVDGLIQKDPNTVGNHAVAVDYDLDGRVDIIVGYGNTAGVTGFYALMKNTMPFTDNNHWLLVTVANEPTRAVTAMLAVVTVYVNGQRQKRRVGSRGAQGGGASYIDTVHFGLGSATRVDCVRVQWSNRVYRKVVDVAADQKIMFGVI